MIHYHGTPVGGSRQDVARFLMGRHACVPFARRDDLAVVIDVCESFIVDNSAFTFWQSGGGAVDFDAYFEWVRSIYRAPGFDWCLIPDVIDGDAEAEQNAALVHKWIRCAGRVRGVPVWHLHEPLEYLEYLVANFETVALGSSGTWRTPGAANWWVRMGEALRVACDAQGRPRCQLHGLRMLDPDIFTRVPFRSCDSTNAAVNNGALSRFGMYVPPTAAQRAAVIAAIIEAQNSPPVWCPTNGEQVALL